MQYINFIQNNRRKGCKINCSGLRYSEDKVDERNLGFSLDFWPCSKQLMCLWKNYSGVYEQFPPTSSTSTLETLYIFYEIWQSDRAQSQLPSEKFRCAPLKPSSTSKARGSITLQCNIIEIQISSDWICCHFEFLLITQHQMEILVSLDSLEAAESSRYEDMYDLSNRKLTI